ncbi:hypothetical protein TNCV_924991 [Trichonephila clavipes]|nr:hypothetical protein TNCV_924991 [Trichonephila clavipes]
MCPDERSDVKPKVSVTAMTIDTQLKERLLKPQKTLPLTAAHFQMDISLAFNWSGIIFSDESSDKLRPNDQQKTNPNGSRFGTYMISNPKEDILQPACQYPKGYNNSYSAHAELTVY